MAVATDVTVRFSAKESKSNDLGESKMTHLIQLVSAYGSGTSSSQFDRVYSDSANVVSGTPYQLDVLGALTSVLDGSPVSFVDLCGIVIRNKSVTSGQTLTVGGGSNAVIPAQKPFGPSGVYVWFDPIDGMSPAAGTGDILQITASSGTVAIDILLLGRSA